MGLLDTVLGAIGPQGSGGDSQAQLIQAVAGLLGSTQQGGGLAGLVTQLQQSGLGDAVSSWVGSGQNLPVSAEQLQGALGGDMLGGLARQLGQGEGELAGMLSNLLPQIVDGMTPQGRVPDGGAGDMGQLGGLLAGLLGPR